MSGWPTWGSAHVDKSVLKHAVHCTYRRRKVMLLTLRLAHLCENALIAPACLNELGASWVLWSSVLPDIVALSILFWRYGAFMVWVFSKIVSKSDTAHHISNDYTQTVQIPSIQVIMFFPRLRQAPPPSKLSLSSGFPLEVTGKTYLRWIAPVSMVVHTCGLRRRCSLPPKFCGHQKVT